LEEIAVAIALAEAANEVKGAEIQVLFVKPLIYWARYFVLATAFSKPQVDAIGYAQNLI
jgi:ribosomal silencing factor RsfS